MKVLKVTLYIKPPFLSNQQGALPFGIDAQSQHLNKLPVILGSLIKGNLRELMTHINHPYTQNWLGKDSKNSINNHSDEYAGLIFSYFWRLNNSNKLKKNIRKRIKIGEKGTVDNGMLRFAEVLETKNGKPLKFTGYIYLNPRKIIEGQAIDLNQIKAKLQKLISSLPALGSNRGIGYGRIKKASISIEDSNISPTNVLSPDDHRTILESKQLDILIKPLWPICFNKTTTGNDLVSKDYIPASAIKAILASNIGGEKTKLQSQFDRMRITHALYTANSAHQKPIAIPLSIAIINSEPHDLSLNNSAQLINNEAPKFQPNWKDSDFAKYTKTPPQPELHLQVRNRHSKEFRAAENEALFSMESLKPHNNYCWRARINLPDEDTDALLKAIIQATKDELFPLGKTQAPANIKIQPSLDLIHIPELTTQKTVIITLQSPAQIFSMGNDKVKNMPLTGGKEKLDELYKESWAALSNNSLGYQHSYSRQILKGGEAWYKQFGKKTQDHYQPQIFIEKGSVFVFKINDPEEAQKKLNDWQRFGLPTPDGVSNDWKENPWIRENGYGEVQINIVEESKNHD